MLTLLESFSGRFECPKRVTDALVVATWCDVAAVLAVHPQKPREDVCCCCFLVGGRNLSHSCGW